MMIRLTTCTKACKSLIVIHIHVYIYQQSVIVVYLSTLFSNFSLVRGTVTAATFFIFILSFQYLSIINFDPIEFSFTYISPLATCAVHLIQIIVNEPDAFPDKL